MNKKITLSFLLSLSLSFFTVYSFSDIENYQFQTAINYMQEQGIVEGYQDGTYKPENTINRAEFTKIIVASLNPSDLETYANSCFPDIEAESWFSSYVCFAKENEIIGGYPDGTFKAEQDISIAEASKIISISLNLNPGNSSIDWYSPYISGLEYLKAIPNTINSLDKKITRGEMAEILWRIKTENQNIESTNLENVSTDDNIELSPTENEESEITEATQEEIPNQEPSNSCQKLGENLPTNVDMDRVRQAWLEWTNEVRAQEGLNPYTINPQLNRTATNWSEIAKTRGYIDHKRDGQTAYYDYGMIQDWFVDQGLEFETVSSHQFVENITWSTFTCTADDCTDTVINNLKNYGFDFFMSEKGSSYAPHYNSIVSPYYREIGMGLAIDPGNKYYFTVHYDTSIISDPLPICE